MGTNFTRSLRIDEWSPPPRLNCFTLPRKWNRAADQLYFPPSLTRLIARRVHTMSLSYFSQVQVFPVGLLELDLQNMFTMSADQFLQLTPLPPQLRWLCPGLTSLVGSSPSGVSQFLPFCTS